MGIESSEREPNLPENTTAGQLLDDYSEKARAEIAQSQGLSLIAFDRYLNARARRERIAVSVAKAEESLGKAKYGEAMKDDNEVVAEEAVIRGMKEVLRRFSPEVLSEDEIDALEREAYAEMEKIGETTFAFLHGNTRERLKRLFRRVVEARAQNEILKLVHEGMVETEARNMVAESLLEQDKRTNLNPLKAVLISVSGKLKGEYVSWNERETQKLAELESIIDGYGKRDLTPQESELLAAFVRAAKANYLNGTYPSSPILNKYTRMLGVIFSAYRNYGPYKRTFANVAGPAEVFTPHQSGYVAGYSRKNKARPHRDPSGGNGES